MSYVNAILYSKVLMSSGSESTKQSNDEKVINADDPQNAEAIQKELYG